MFKGLYLRVTFGLVVSYQSLLAAPLAEIRIRGSFAINEPQLALELFRLLPEGTSESERKNRFITCRSFGRGVTSWVECRIDMRDSKERSRLVGSMRFSPREEGLFLNIATSDFESVKPLMVEENDFVVCSVEAKQAICRLKWD